MSDCKATTKTPPYRCGIRAIKGADFCWRHTLGYKTPLQTAQEENEKLKKFAREFISTECWGYQAEIDGGTVQEVAAQCGLIASHPATEQDCIDFAEYDIEVGDDVFTFTDVLKER